MSCFTFLGVLPCYRASVVPALHGSCLAGGSGVTAGLRTGNPWVKLHTDVHTDVHERESQPREPDWLCVLCVFAVAQGCYSASCSTR